MSIRETDGASIPSFAKYMHVEKEAAGHSLHPLDRLHPRDPTLRHLRPPRDVEVEAAPKPLPSVPARAVRPARRSKRREAGRQLVGLFLTEASSVCQRGGLLTKRRRPGEHEVLHGHRFAPQPSHPLNVAFRGHSPSWRLRWFTKPNDGHGSIRRCGAFGALATVGVEGARAGSIANGGHPSTGVAHACCTRACVRRPGPG